MSAPSPQPYPVLDLLPRPAIGGSWHRVSPPSCRSASFICSLSGLSSVRQSAVGRWNTLRHCGHDPQSHNRCNITKAPPSIPSFTKRGLRVKPFCILFIITLCHSYNGTYQLLFELQKRKSGKFSGLSFLSVLFFIKPIL